VSTDTLSEVLRAVRLTGAIFFAIDASVPWVIETPVASEIGPHLMPGVEHVIEYHVIAAGSGWGGVLDDEPVRLETGDIIVFPQGDAHVMSSLPGMRGTPDQESIQKARTARLPLAVKTGGGGEQTQVICGFLGCDARPFNPLLATLPRTMHVPRGSDDGVLEQFVKLALMESTSTLAGSEAVLARLSELMFVEVVRRYLSKLPPENVGAAAGPSALWYRDLDADQTERNEAFAGVGAAGWAGYDAWISSNWSLGGYLRLTAAWTRREVDYSGSQLVEEQANGTTLAALFSALYH
jgi:hypothetical protein